MSQLYLCHITHPDRCSIHSLHRDIGNILQILYHTDATDVILVGILFDITAARIGIVTLQGIKHLAYGNTACIQLVGINGYFILLDVTTPATDLSNTRSTGKLFADYPILYCSELGERVFVLVSLLGTNGIMVDFAQSGGDRSHLGFGILRQFFLHLLHHLANLRTRPIDIGGVIEDKRDNRKSTS